MEQHLVDFLYAVYQPNQKNEPLFIIKRDRLNKLLSLLLSKPPPEYNPFKKTKEPYLELILPYFEKLNINTYYYLSHRSQRIFAKQVSTIFDVQFFNFIDDCMIEGLDKIEAINLFIEKYTLPDHLNFQDRLLKKIQRSEKILKKFPTRSYKKRSV